MVDDFVERLVRALERADTMTSADRDDAMDAVWDLVGEYRSRPLVTLTVERFPQAALETP